jgi:hypothetical protein
MSLFELNSHNGGGGGSTRHVCDFWPIVPAPSESEDGEFGGMKIGRGSRSTRRKPAPVPLRPPPIPLDQTRARTRGAVVRSQRLTAGAMAQPHMYVFTFYPNLSSEAIGKNQRVKRRPLFRFNRKQLISAVYYDIRGCDDGTPYKSVSCLLLYWRQAKDSHLSYPTSFTLPFGAKIFHSCDWITLSSAMLAVMAPAGRLAM